MLANLGKMLADAEELNREMDADPELAMNMAEMGFIKRVPFQIDHNGATVSKWAWTDYGQQEMRERLVLAITFAGATLQ